MVIGYVFSRKDNKEFATSRASPLDYDLFNKKVYQYIKSCVLDRKEKIK
ncbi:MAG: hypothetical protein J6A28_01710 [Clostridia bacterium]|nr:hypothetical protein [Clostridia bacterium]